MVKQYATIGFIAAVAIIALVVGTRTTRIDSKVMADWIYEQLAPDDPELVRIECEDQIPIRRDGARFLCTQYGTGGPGDKVDVEYALAPDGSLRASPFVSRRRRP